MEEETTKKILNTLESIDATLKRIEQNQEETIKNAVFDALCSNKHKKDAGKSAFKYAGNSSTAKIEDAPKIQIRQCDGENGIFTEIIIGGHKLQGVRRFQLKQGAGNSIPTLTVDLNALNLSTDLRILQVNQEGIGEVESIKFKGYESPVVFSEE